MNSTRMTRTIRAGAIALFLAVAAVLSLGVTTMDVKAETKNTVGVAQAVENNRETCETIGGGKLVVMDGPGGSVTVECKGGTGNGDYCFISPSTIKCSTGDHKSAPSNQDILWQDVTGDDQTAPTGNVAGGNYQTPLESEALPVGAEPAATPVFDTDEAATDDSVVADTDTTASPEDAADDVVPDLVGGEPVVTGTDGTLGNGPAYDEQLVNNDGGFDFHTFDQQ
jgi:hypothetical protein